MELRGAIEAIASGDLTVRAPVRAKTSWVAWHRV